ncbi:kinase-like domain-containing protein [Pholiota molesta]|nr:kinase-like domain-containing protein [Pholiota molesta]
MVQNAVNETTQARSAAVRERFGKQAQPSTTLRSGVTTADIGTLNTTQSLLHHEHGGGAPGEEKVSIGWQVRCSNVPKRIDPNLGAGIRKHAMSRFMSDIKADILATINIDWARSNGSVIQPEETSFRWSGNRTLDPNTANLSARDFYDYYNRPSEGGNAAIRNSDIPTFFKGPMKGQKGPKLFLEIYIDHTAVKNSSYMAASLQKKRNRNDSTASLTSAKAKQVKASEGNSIFQSEFNVSTRARRIGTILETRASCNEVKLEKHVCVASARGAPSILGTGNTLVGSLNSKPFGRGSMKLAYDLYVENGDHLVAKRFFRLDSNIRVDDENQVPEEYEHQDAIENEGLRLAEGAWFLKEFYKYCARLEYSDVEIDKNIQFSTAFVGKELSYPRSQASGKADELGKPLVCWLIEPKRPSTVIKFSGTLKHPATRKDMLGLTIYAFAHFVYLTSKGSRVMADIQGTTSHINGKDTMVLFDVMTHSNAGDTGIGDFGIEGIESFLRDHTCGMVCRGLGLHEKHVASDEKAGSEDSDDSEEIDDNQGDPLQVEDGLEYTDAA